MPYERIEQLIRRIETIWEFTYQEGYEPRMAERKQMTAQDQQAMIAEARNHALWMQHNAELEANGHE